MLKRAWLFISVAWTALWLWDVAITPSGYRALTWGDAKVMIAIPWIGGMLFILFWRYVRHGSFAKPTFRRYPPNF